ncbi:MAG: GNVR domain-containing protein, partial [Chloroflexota bacterium]|nr:GNVR domain-containing protein [Chloroflexota bacterium]
LYARDNAIEQQLTDARSLREHLASGEQTEGSWGTELAFINLQARAYGGSLPGLVQWDLTGVAPTVTVPEVDRLIASLGAKQAEIREQITTLAQQVGSVEPIELQETSGNVVEEQTQALTEELAALQAQLEAQQAQQAQLTTSRDVAWTTYKSLTNKLLELQVEGTVSTSEARVAFEALPPTERSAPRRLLNTALAGVIGLMLGIFTAFAMAYLQPENAEETLPAASPAGNSLARWFLAEASGLPGFNRGNGRKAHVVEVPEEEKALAN